MGLMSGCWRRLKCLGRSALDGWQEAVGTVINLLFPEVSLPLSTKAKSTIEFEGVATVDPQPPAHVGNLAILALHLWLRGLRPAFKRP